MTSHKVRALHVPLGTRCEAITQHGYAAPRDSDGWSIGQDNIVYRVWLAIANKQVPPEKYMGTYLELLPDGSIRQCSTDMQEYEVMEPLHDSKR